MALPYEWFAITSGPFYANHAYTCCGYAALCGNAQMVAMQAPTAKGGQER